MARTDTLENRILFLRLLLVLIQILRGYVVFRYLAGLDFLRSSPSAIFNTRHDSSLEGVPLFDQLVDTFRIRGLDVGQSLQISGLSSRARP